MNINPATSRRPMQLPPEAFARPAELYGHLPNPETGSDRCVPLCASARVECSGFIRNAPPHVRWTVPSYNYARRYVYVLPLC